MAVCMRLFRRALSSGLLGPRAREVTAVSCSGVEPRARVCILGATGRAGWTAALLLKTSRLIGELRLHDTNASVRRIALDLSHVSTTGNVTAHIGSKGLHQALLDADIVLVALGRVVGGDRDEEMLFSNNAPLVKDIAEMCTSLCPLARVAITSEPVNSLVPLFAEVMQQAQALDTSRVLGVSSLDVVRASSTLARLTGLHPGRVEVPVVGGRSSATAVPVLSSAHPFREFTDADCQNLLLKLRAMDSSTGEGEVEATHGDMGRGYASARTILGLVRAMAGESVREYAFVRSQELNQVRFLSTAVLLDCRGVNQVLGVPPMNHVERGALLSALPKLTDDIERGERFARCSLI